jgi:hypothetical protein
MTPISPVPGSSLRSHDVPVSCCQVQAAGVGKKTKKQGGIKVCEKGHPLRIFRTPHDEYVCDACDTGEFLEQGAVMLGCRICDWDACEKCASPATLERELEREAAYEKKSASKVSSRPRGIPIGCDHFSGAEITSPVLECGRADDPAARRMHRRHQASGKCWWAQISTRTNSCRPPSLPPALHAPLDHVSPSSAAAPREAAARCSTRRRPPPALQARLRAHGLRRAPAPPNRASLPASSWSV